MAQCDGSGRIQGSNPERWLRHLWRLNCKLRLFPGAFVWGEISYKSPIAAEFCSVYGPAAVAQRDNRQVGGKMLDIKTVIRDDKDLASVAAIGARVAGEVNRLWPNPISCPNRQ
jgi:hypothetical protein